MNQLAARAAPSVICGRKRPFRFGNMTKPLQFVPDAPNPTRFGLPHKRKALPSSRTTEPKQTEKKCHTEAAPDTLRPILQVRIISLRRMKYFKASVRLVDSLGNLCAGSLSPVFCLTITLELSGRVATLVSVTSISDLRFGPLCWSINSVNSVRS